MVILCDAGYPPYSYAEGDEAKGLYTDILRAAFKRMPGYRVDIRPMPWARGLAEVASGRAFALFPPYYRPSERPWMDYSRPMLKEKVVVLCPSLAVAQATHLGCCHRWLTSSARSDQIGYLRGALDWHRNCFPPSVNRAAEVRWPARYCQNHDGN